MVRTDGAGAGHAFMTWLQAGVVVNRLRAHRCDGVGQRRYRPTRADDVADRDARDHQEGTPAPRRAVEFTDADCRRSTAFATDTVRAQVQDLELRHRRRAQSPLHGFDRNRIWPAIVQSAKDVKS